MKRAQEFVRAKREAFNTAYYAMKGESLQGVKIGEVVDKLVEDHYGLEPITFDWDHAKNRDPGDQYNFVWRDVQMSGDVGMLQAQLEGSSRAGDTFEIKGSTLTVKFFTSRNTPEQRQAQWDQIKAHWEGAAADALKEAKRERDSDISFAKQHLAKVAQNYRDKNQPLP